MDADELSRSQRNWYRALWEFSHGITGVESIPSNLQIARSNLCNFKCVYCIDHRTGNHIPRTKNEGETWDRLLKLIPRASVLSFHGVSEFMIDPEFFDIVQRCSDAGVTLSINTNGSVCTPKHLNVLACYPGYLSINFSLDAATPETFLKIRGWDFYRVIRNIKAYADRFKDRRDRTWISLSFVITRSNVKEMLPFLYLAKSLGVNAIKYYRLHEYDGLDWRVETGDGVFDYRKECTSTFAAEYNRCIALTRQAAEILELDIELPASSVEGDVREAKNE